MMGMRGGGQPNRGSGQGGGPRGGPPGSQQVEKAKDFKSALVKLLKLLVPHKILVTFIFIMAIASTIFSIYSPKVSARFINEIVDGLTAKLFIRPMAEMMEQTTGASRDYVILEQHFDVELTEEQVKKLVISETMSASLSGKEFDPADLLGYTQADFKNALENADKLDLEKDGIDAKAVGIIALTLAGLYILSFIFTYMQQRLMAVITNKTMYDLRNKVNEKLSHMPLSYFDQTARGEIMSRMTNDIDNMSGTLQQNLTQIVTAGVTIVGVLVMMLSINIVMTLICLVTIPLCMFVLIMIMGRSRKFFAKQWEITGDLNAHIEEMYTGHTIVKVFSKEEAAVKDFQEMNEKLFKTSKTAQFLSGLIFPLMGFINNIGYVLICVAGGIFAINGKIKIGDIQAMIQYSRTFTQQINQSSNIINTIQSALASAERVFALLEESEELPESNKTSLAKVNDTVTFESVEFYYDEEKPLIKNMNLDVKAGQMVAIVGPTGAGKTTLVNLLMRFYDIKNGAIKVNGVDVRDVPRGELRNAFSMVLQDTWLFSGTIYDNIAYGREGSTKEEIYAAAKAARADHFIDTLPEGYDTILEEDGANISQGQRQLLTIARAINARHDILILDEATSSVDTRTEILIQKAMTVLMKGKTSFVIAHRLSTIRGADIILVMNHGNIIEQGSHDELLEKGGFYSELYKSQFEN